MAAEDAARRAAQAGPRCAYCSRPINSSTSNAHIIEEDGTLKRCHSGCGNEVLDRDLAVRVRPAMPTTP